MKKLGLFLIAIFISFQTSAFAHDGENELEQNKIFNGIENYDKRKGWRGPVKNINLSNQNWKDLIKNNLEKKVITIVCYANFCRSPVIKKILESKTSNFIFDSAGIISFEIRSNL